MDEMIGCEEFYDDAAFEAAAEVLAEMARYEVNGLLQLAADEAAEAALFDRWVEEVGCKFLASEFCD
jgi:hypothetical protein